MIRYDEIKTISNELRMVNVVAYVPKPIAADYDRGYIDRFFVQRTNDLNAPIIEISPNSVSYLHSKGMYNVVSLEWRISGDLVSVRKSNFNSITIAKQQMVRIDLYLPNLIQFVK